ncbi:MAG: FecR domain-containing protein [Sphingobacteriales bacterium]|nr:FecR domain-containing protein [Sphingobacteriales bacterium]OJY81933.1 MAG: hypothetical protein BGP14_04060 [Sphingobacteriales bacterium 44-15]
MKTEYLKSLLKKYNAGKCTPEEKLWLEQWYLSFEWSKMDDISSIQLQKLKEDTWNNLRQSGYQSPGENTRLSGKSAFKRKWWYYGAAAALLIACFVPVWMRHKPVQTVAVSVAKDSVKVNDFLPGISKALLVMANGSVVTLDSTGTGELKEADGTKINTQSGQLVYHTLSESNSPVLYNTLNIPRGAEYRLVLADGSKVWMNAASSLRFPTRFTGKERIVYLTGEAYFEVAKNPAKPFKVKTDDNMEVEVMGTHFNIMAYEDESWIRTTLIEGSVKVKSREENALLVPSQQAALQKNTRKLLVKEVDIDKEIAWKNGIIEFNDDELPYIMRQLSRWYDVEVSFEGDVPKGTYNGSIPRKATLSEVMEILRLAGVKYWLDNKRVVITSA